MLKHYLFNSSGALAIFWIILFSSPVQAQLEYCRSPNTALVETEALVDTIAVPDTGRIGKVKVKLDFEHTYVGDVRVNLRHVSTATNIAIIDRPGVPVTVRGCSRDDFDVTLDDAAGSPAEDE